MTFFMRFVMTLTCGLVGLGMVMKILLERVFHDWDACAALARWFEERSGGAFVHSQRTEDVLMEAQKNKMNPLAGRVIDKRREELNTIHEVETRLMGPSKAEPAFSGEQESRWFSN